MTDKTFLEYWCDCGKSYTIKSADESTIIFCWNCGEKLTPDDLNYDPAREA